MRRWLIIILSRRFVIFFSRKPAAAGPTIRWVTAEKAESPLISAQIITIMTDSAVRIVHQPSGGRCPPNFSLLSFSHLSSPHWRSCSPILLLLQWTLHFCSLVDLLLTYCWPIVDLLLTYCWPIVWLVFDRNGQGRVLKSPRAARRSRTERWQCRF